MKFSIITISYNQVSFLEETIISVIEQDYKNIEYIIVDPGSTDGSREIIEKYRNNISQVIYEPDNGPPDGLNKGFSIATGDIFGFLNSDDVLEKNALSSVARFFNSHPQVDVVSGHSWIIDAKGRKKRKFYSDRYSLIMAAYGSSILSQPSTFFRNDLFKNTNGFNRENRSNWDGELYVDMALNGALFSLTNDFLSRYRVHEDSITGSGRMKKLHDQHAKKIFGKIMGRNINKYDILIFIITRYIRKILNIRDTFERICNGSIFKSKL